MNELIGHGLTVRLLIIDTRRTSLLRFRSRFFPEKSSDSSSGGSEKASLSPRPPSTTLEVEGGSFFLVLPVLPALAFTFNFQSRTRPDGNAAFGFLAALCADNQSVHVYIRFVDQNHDNHLVFSKGTAFLFFPSLIASVATSTAIRVSPFAGFFVLC